MLTIGKTHIHSPFYKVMETKMHQRVKKIIRHLRYLSITAGLLFLSPLVHAEGRDLLANALQGDIASSFGSGAMFWKVFVLVDIIFATALAVKSKNPMVFIGVAAIAFIPAFLLKAFVF